MPKYRPLKKLGVHRVACFALYRALLRQCSQTPLLEQYQVGCQDVISSTFRTNAKIQSPRRIRAALELGHKALEILRQLASQRAEVHPRLSEFLSKFAAPNSSNDLSIPTPTEEHTTRRHGEPKPEHLHVKERQNIPKVVDRPYESLSGRRHVPKFVNANGLPMLRFKKPQSAFLSRVLNDKIERRIKLYDDLRSLEEEIHMARQEDEWDRLLSEECWVGNWDDELPGKEEFWADSVMYAIHDTRRRIEADKRRTSDLARRLYGVVEKEKALAALEKKQAKEKKGFGNLKGSLKDGLDDTSG